MEGVGRNVGGSGREQCCSLDSPLAQGSLGNFYFRYDVFLPFQFNFLSIDFIPFPGVFPVMEAGCCLQLGNSPIIIFFSHLPE